MPTCLDALKAGVLYMMLPVGLVSMAVQVKRSVHHVELAQLVCGAALAAWRFETPKS
jgi:hypothetical protein